MAAKNVSFEDSTMDEAVKHIYAACDPNNTDSVPVHSLIEFVKPYMPDNLDELHELETQLDPDRTNRPITSKNFYEAMDSWSAKLKEKQGNDSFEILEEPIEQGKMPFGQSTPRSSLGYQQFLRNCSEMINKSNSSLYETSFNITVGLEKTTYEEQIQELKHLLNKTTYDLEVATQQLAVAEEQNESLLSELNQVKNSLTSQKQVLDKLKREKLDYDSVQEEANAAKHHIEHLEKVLAYTQREQINLSSEVKILEEKEVLLQKKLETLQNREKNSILKLEEMNEELVIKETEISNLVRLTNELKFKLEDREEMVRFYNKETSLAKHRVSSLEKLLHDQCPEMPLQDDLDDSFEDIFISPILMKQINNPVSPTMNSPVPLKKKSSEENLRKRVLLMHCSTPKSSNSCPDLNGNEPFINLEELQDLKNTPPTMYVMERSPTLEEISSPQKLTSPQIPLKSRTVKTLQEELQDANKNKKTSFSEDQEVIRLKNDLKEQEYIKNSLWERYMSFRQNNEDLTNTLKLTEETLTEYKQKLDEKHQQLIVEQESNQKTKDAFEAFKIAHEEQIEALVSENTTLQEKYRILNDKYIEQEKDYCFIAQTNETLENAWKKSDSEVQEALKIAEKMHKKLTQMSVGSGPTKAKVTLCGRLEEVNQLIEQFFVKLPKSKKLNFEKNQLKMERMNEKLENLERCLVLEKNINGDLCEKLQKSEKDNEEIRREHSYVTGLLQEEKDMSQKHINENEKIREAVLVLEDEKSCLNKQIGDLIESLRELQDQNRNIGVCNENLKCSLQEVNSQLNIHNALLNTMNMEKQHQHIVQQNSCVAIGQLTNTLQQKDSQIINEMTRIEAVWAFVIERNEILERALASLTHHSKHYNEGMRSLFMEMRNLDHQEGSSLEKDMLKLNNLIKIIIELLDILDERNQQMQKKMVTKPVRFISCGIQVSRTSMELEEFPTQLVSPNESQTLLNNFKIDETTLRKLSKKEMEDAFKAHSLMLALNLSSSKSRYQEHRESHSALIAKYFQYLNATIALLGSIHLEDLDVASCAITYLESLKNVTASVLQSAEQFGMLQYEMHTINFWNLVTNYVALLNQELKQSHLTYFCMRTLNCFLICCLVIFCIFAAIIFYMDWACVTKHSTYCPLEWFFGSFVERTYFGHRPL